MINENPYKIVHLNEGVVMKKSSKSEKTNPKVAPHVMNIWWQLVNVPEISIGESYFIINGAIELNNPVQ